MSTPGSELPSLLMQAAQSAAIADGLVKAPPPQKDVVNEKIKNNRDALEAALAMVNSSKSDEATQSMKAGNGQQSNGSGRPNSGAASQTNDPSVTVNGAIMLTKPIAVPAAAPTNGTVASNKQEKSTSSVTSVKPPAPAGGSSSQSPTTSSSSAAVTSAKPDNANGSSKPAVSAGSAAHMLAVQQQEQHHQRVIKSPPPPTKPRPSSSSSVSPVPRSGSSGGTGGGNGGAGSSGGGGGKKKGPSLRRGKWTQEEEAYANRLITEFKAGLLPLTDGTTLRTFLSKLLNCDPMRISKKFVGNNCIGKQVFRRRTADINRLTPEQIQQSRAELSELERRFLERVTQTNRVKSSGVSGNNSGPSGSAAAAIKLKAEESLQNQGPPSPPWLRPPAGFKHGTGAAVSTSSLSSGTVNRAALAGRALLQQSGLNQLDQSKTPSLSGSGSSSNNLSSGGSTNLLALLNLQRQQTQNSVSNLLAEAAKGDSNANISGSAMAQISKNASAARMASLVANGSVTNNLMMKTGLSRDQLSLLAREQARNSSTSLSNMMERQSSLDALMSLDFQSLQSIDNLANLIQTGGAPQVPKSGMKNWSSDGNSSLNNIAAIAASIGASNNNNNNSGLASSALPSEQRMESLIRSLSNNNVANKVQNCGGSNANFNNILQSMQNNLNNQGKNNSAASLFGNAASAMNLANMLRTDSSTGLTALRAQDGLAQRNSSVDDFLSLVASGDIPHQDPHMLNIPLQTVLQTQQQQQNNQSGAQAAATYLAQQQLLAQANNSNPSSLSQQIASLSNLANSSSAASLLNQYNNSQSNNSMALSLAQQLQQATAMAAAQQNNKSSSGQLKRKHSGPGLNSFDDERNSKRKHL